jgi:pyridoxal 5'-phosphate synthase pdxS subunit
MASQSTPDKNGSKSTWTLKTGLAQMLKGGVIMDVVTVEHAKIAEEAGAVAVMALERVPADIRAAGGVARMSDPEMIHAIMEAVTIPVMAKARIGHFVEAQVLEAIGVDYVDEVRVTIPDPNLPDGVQTVSPRLGLTSDAVLRSGQHKVLVQ